MSGDALAIDGKIIRDHPGLIVTLVDMEDGTPVAVMANTLGKGQFHLRVKATPARDKTNSSLVYPGQIASVTSFVWQY